MRRKPHPDSNCAINWRSRDGPSTEQTDAYNWAGWPDTVPKVRQDQVKQQKQLAKQRADYKSGKSKFDPDEGRATDVKQLNMAAASVIMKTMYGARLARADLLRAVGHLSTHLTLSLIHI